MSNAKDKLVLAMDQGTTSSRAILFDSNYAIVEQAQCEFEQHFPNSGWVEHNPMDIWQTSLDTARQAIANAGVSAEQIASIGITNQRETTVIWDRQTGEPIHNAIVWQDRRTAELCDKLKAEGLEPKISSKTGLLLDPYFSATKIAWLLDNIDGARHRAERGELAFGTMDSWLLWNLTGGKSHATDATNASRTMLYNIHRGEWDCRATSALQYSPITITRGQRLRSRFWQHQLSLASQLQLWVWPAISTPPHWGRPALKRACSNPPTAPAVLHC